MIKLMFKKNNNFIAFIISDRIITSIIKGITLPYFPMKLDEVKNKIILSRNKIPANMIFLYKLPRVDLDEFENAKTEEEFKEILIKDAKKQGAELIN